jgi:hypothetical protein
MYEVVTGYATMRYTVFLCFMLPAVLWAGEPAYYEKRDSWHATLMASREALLQQQGGEARGLPLPDFGKDAFTIAAWIKTSSDGTILAKAPAQGKWAPQGKALFIGGGRLNYDIGWVGCVAGKRKVADNAWHHVALTGPKAYDFYVDGKLDASGALAPESDVPGHVVKLGSTSTNFPNTSAFSGLLDDLRVYRTRLSAADIARLCETGKTERDGADTLIAHFAFDGDALDASGNKNDAAPPGKGVSFAAGKAGQAVALDGKNHLTVAGRGPDTAKAAIWDLVTRDFADAQSVREMSWERELLEADWKPGDWAALAARYAKACTAGQASSGTLAEQARKLAAEARDAAGCQAVRAAYHRVRQLDAALATLRGLNTKALRQGIAELTKDFGPQYARGQEHLARLAALEQTIADASAKPDAAAVLARAVEEIAALRHTALITENPLLAFGKLLFIKRKTYQASHYYTDYIDGCKHFGGNISVLDLRTGKVEDLIPELAGGIFGRFDLSYDATRIVFDWKKALDAGFRIYEVGVDGRGLRQLTFPPADEQELAKKYRTVGTPTGTPYLTGTDDMHPCYLPDGDIAFVTTRCQKGILCDGPDVLTTTVLYRMDKDGKNMRPISFNSVSEATPSVSQDGRILYTRWEYVDKGGSGCKCIWAMHPDGSGSMEIYGNNISHPVTFIDCRDIPGAPDSFICVGAPHMPLGVGSILRLNTKLSLRTLEPITNLTPEIETPDEHGYRHLRDGKWVHDYKGPFFREPYPLSYKFFLVTHNPDKPWNELAGYGIYLLDEFGNRELINKDAEFSCWGPYPLRSRPLPPIIPPASGDNYATPTGTLFLQDVYIGLTGIERGRVKYLRVMEDVPRPWSARRNYPGDANGSSQQHVATGLWGHLAPKNTHGIVPVEADGSAHFTVPADKNVFFQALDENYMELQRMRTFVNLRAGEYRGCVGCHEEKALTPPVGKVTPLAMRYAARKPVAQPGEAVPRAVHYPTDVQPMLEKHCVRCHSDEKPNGISLSSAPTDLFSRSYENLIRKRWAGFVIDEIGGSGTGGKHAHIAATPPLTYGSHTSKLVALLRKGHYEVKLSQEEMIRLLTWIDANAPYYGSWDGRRNLRYKDAPDFRPAPEEPLRD